MDDIGKIWYYVSNDGQTMGPVTIGVMKSLYGNKIQNDTYIWNGTNVPNWTFLEKVPDVFTQLNAFKNAKQKPESKKPEPQKTENETTNRYQKWGAQQTGDSKTEAKQLKASNDGKISSGSKAEAPNKSASNAQGSTSIGASNRKRSPFGGGGRSALLAGIQKGTKLKSVPQPTEKNNASESGSVGGKGKGGGRNALLSGIQKGVHLKKSSIASGTSSGSKASQKARPLSMMEQLKLAQNKRKQGSSKMVQLVKSKSLSSNSAPKSSEINRDQLEIKNQKMSGSPSSSLGYRKDKIISKLQDAQDWQLKAIEAILK